MPDNKGPSKALQQYMAASGDTQKIISASDTASRWDAVEYGFKVSAQGKVVAGYHLKSLRDELPSREFAVALRERQIPRRRAYEAIEIYELFNQINDLNVIQAIGNLGTRKCLAVSKIKYDDLLRLASGEEVEDFTLEDFGRMSARELEQQLRESNLLKDERIAKLKADNATARAQLEDKDLQLEELRNQLNNRHPTDRLPYFAALVREEAGALSEEVATALDSMEQVLDEHLFDVADTRDDDVLRSARLAAGTAFQSLQAQYGHLGLILKRLQEAFGEDVLGELNPQFGFIDEEVNRFKDRRELILGIHRTNARKRDAVRENNKPGRRGRKRSES